LVLISPTSGGLGLYISLADQKQRVCLFVLFIGKLLCDGLAVQNGVKQGNDLSALLSDFALEYTIREYHETRQDCN
jgi:hypothetical protein